MPRKAATTATAKNGKKKKIVKADPLTTKERDILSSLDKYHHRAWIPFENLATAMEGTRLKVLDSRLADLATKGMVESTKGKAGLDYRLSPEGRKIIRSLAAK
jgi:DNA-binding HxlR family transcriptional regulator